MEREQIRKTIEERIVLLDYKPGERLKDDELCEEFDIGRTPLRETLIELENKGLVRMIPRKGIYASNVSLQELRNAYEVRSFLIRLSGKKAARNIKISELKKLRELIDRMENETEPRELIKLDFRAHELINRASDNDVLAQKLRELRQQTMRGWAAPNFKGVMEDFADEYSSLVDALRKGEERKSGNILAEHLENFHSRLSDKFISTEHGKRRV
jgi:DNA-binding GntR family transcriptional regulator